MKTEIKRSYSKDEFMALISKLFPDCKVSDFRVDNTPHGQIPSKHPFVVVTEISGELASEEAADSYS
jgi:hypothetical protein